MKFDWDNATARDRDAWVAEHVLEWEPMPPEPGSNMRWFRPDEKYARSEGGKRILSTTPLPFTADAAADFVVLERVRETWSGEQAEAFSGFLCQIIQAKDREERYKKTPRGCHRTAWMCWYEPGDYSHAAWMAMTRE